MEKSAFKRMDDKRLNDCLWKFLETRRKSDGDYAPVTDEDMLHLENILHRLVELKCEADPDGDRPIEWILVNRRTHERLYLRPIRYTHQNALEALKDALRNAAMAHARLETIISTADTYLRAFEKWQIEQEGI